MDASNRVYGVGYLTKQTTLKLDMEKCQACGVCVEACPKQVLEITHVSPSSKVGKNDYIPDIKDPKSCSYCGVCQALCPFEALSLSDGGEEIKTEELEIIAKKAFPRLNYEIVKCSKTGKNAKSYFEGSISLKEGSDWTGFKICADVCPTEALTFKDAEKKLVLDDKKCIYCGSCQVVAPKSDMINLKRTGIKISGAYNKTLWEPLKTRLLK